MKFSIIVPVYNSEIYLKRCLKSLLNQSLTDIEIIAINDGSTDLSLSILKQLAKEETRLKVFSQANFGPSAARNLGILNATGEYLSFVDADDWLENNAFAHLNEQIIKNEMPDIVMFNAYKNDVIKNKPFLKTGIYNKEGIKEHIYPRLIESLDKLNGSAIRASVWLRVFKRDLINKKIEFKNELSNNEDLVFCLETTIKANSFLYLADSYLYHNCMTVGSISRGYMETAFDRMKSLFGILSNISNKYNEYDFREQIKARVFRTIIFCYENEFRQGNNTSILKKYGYIKKLMKDKEVKSYLSNFNPSKEKSKLLYYYLYKNKMVFFTMILANYKIKKHNKKVYV